MKHTIEVIKIEECFCSDYIKPKSMYYLHNNVQKRWDIVHTHDSVAILLYHETLDSFIFVKQFRPSIYLKNNDGFTYELCAGIVDKDKTLIEIAQEEVLEETGYDVPLAQLDKVASFYTAVGFAGGRQTLYYAIVDEGMKVSDGGGVECENIEVIYVKREETLDFMFNEAHATTSGLMFALMWYFKHH